MEFSRVAEVTFDNPLIETSNDAVSWGLEIHMTEEDRERDRETVSKFICSIYVSTLAWLGVNQHLIKDLVCSYFKKYKRVGLREYGIMWIVRSRSIGLAD